jgi:alpha-tubulin suppressor-like RCC1 family protein
VTGRVGLPRYGADMRFRGECYRAGAVGRLRLVVAVAIVAVVAPLAAGAAPAFASDHMWSWGNGNWGSLGDGVSTVVEGSEVVGIPGGVCAVGVEGPCPSGPFLEDVTSMSAGGAHSVAVLDSGTVVAWGENELGQLGDGTDVGPSMCGRKGRVEVERVETEPCSPTPVAVSGLSGVVAVAAGVSHSLALLSDGTVMAWGGNSDGQLGDGTTKGSDAPVVVSGLSGVTAIAAGSDYSLALLSDGTVMAWGGNESGQLGDGSTKRSDVPVAVSGLSGVSAIAAATGGSHSLALLNSGTVMAWGADGEGQLGDGSTEGSDVPVEVSGLTGVTAIAAGEASSLALLSDGAIMSWGTNGGGQLGVGGRESIEFPHEMLAYSDVPVRVCAVGVEPVLLCRSGPFLGGVRAISAGSAYELAVLETSTVGWGDDCYGSGYSPCEPIGFPFIPEPPGGELGVAKLIAAGYGYNLVFGPPLPTLTRIYPTVGLDEGGESVTITGTELAEATAVHFGSVSAPSFTVHSESSITAVTPPEATGVVPVTVTTPQGTSPVVNGIFLHYIATFPRPTIKRLVPDKGPAAGGTSVFITGSGFYGASIAVHFGSTSATSVTVNEIPTEPEVNSLTVVAPPGTGDVAVTVTTLGGTSASTSKTAFKYGGPTVTGVSPGAGPTSGGTAVTVTGSGFAPGVAATSFEFGSALATSVECSSTTTCTMVAPAATKARTVDVRAVVGKAKSKKNAPADHFAYG